MANDINAFKRKLKPYAKNAKLEDFLFHWLSSDVVEMIEHC